MEFKIYEHVEIKDVESFYDFWDFVQKNVNADIEEYYINGGDTDPTFNEDGVYVDMLWIRPRVVSPENIESIIKLLDYIEKYSNVEFEIVDVNFR